MMPVQSFSTSILKKLFFLSCCFLVFSYSNAQDTLPNFSLTPVANDRVQLSWTNLFPDLIQLSVQRSYDSTHYYKTIFSTPSPNLPQNGFVDNGVLPGYKIYYKIQYVFSSGKFELSPAKSILIPLADTSFYVKKNAVDSITIYRNNFNHKEKTVPVSEWQQTKEAILLAAKDKILVEEKYRVLITGTNFNFYWQPSKYVFTNEKGWVQVNLPNLKIRHYKIQIYDENQQPILLIHLPKEEEFFIDKSNFSEFGWYNFDLYENDKLIEKNKFYISPDK